MLIKGDSKVSGREMNGDLGHLNFEKHLQRNKDYCRPQMDVPRVYSSGRSENSGFEWYFMLKLIRYPSTDKPGGSICASDNKTNNNRYDFAVCFTVYRGYH